MRMISIGLTDEMYYHLASETDENLTKHVREIIADYLIKKGYTLTQEVAGWGKSVKKDKSC